ncbi:NAC domain-containing protein 7-like protein [Carex littledalei]|uniref:NAC domain-containing protein 7-like protein n=1 Tax=Carex littledalei TaxID=544730 RepID=A0A833VE27_9POAL|nr:NAC domain-containing protein 7-like protein [Carex littledalei]
MWDPRSCYETNTEKSVVVDPLEYMQMQDNTRYKREEEIDSLNILHYSMSNNPFVQLPDLESPSFPAPKRPRLVDVPDLSSKDEHEHDEEEEMKRKGCNININVGENYRVMDWRELDKFVASQLSPEEMSLADAQAQHSGLTIGASASAFD